MSHRLAVRLRRDFRTILTLIRAHALLHQASRRKDEKGRIIATVSEDYAAVRNLVADLVAAAVEAGVPKMLQETVKAVAAISPRTLLSPNPKRSTKLSLPPA